MKRVNQRGEIEAGRRNRARAGVSLVETLVALSLFATFATGACKLILMNRRISDMARAHYTAANLAKNRLELIRTFDFEQASEFAENKVIINHNGQPDSEGFYRRTTTVNMLSSNLTELVVSVDIKNRRKLTFDGGTETVSTYFALHMEPEE